MQIQKRDPDAIAALRDYRSAIGLRNIFVHDYNHIDDDQVFQIVTELIPDLAANIRQHMSDAGVDSEAGGA